MADFLSQANAFSVEILEGEKTSTGQNKVIRLEGRALPYRGISYGTEQRSKTTYYAGNPVASQQVFGPIEQNTVISGMWKDIFLGNGAAKGLVTTFEGLVRSGFQVKVVWGDTILPSGELPANTKSIVRTGIVKRIVPKFERPQDVAWEIEFEWRGRDEPASAPVLSAGTTDEREGFQAAAGEFGKMVAEINAFVKSPLNKIAGFSQRFEEESDRIQNAIVDGVSILNKVTQALSTQDSLTSDLIERSRGTLQNSAGALRDLIDLLTARGANVESFFLGSMGGTFVDRALSFLDTKTQIYTVCRSSDSSLEKAIQADDSLAAKMLPEVLAEVRPPAGTDLRDLARQYYGDADLWWQIADFNGLSSSNVPSLPDGASDDPARPIRIPRRTDGAPGDLRQAC